MIFSPAITQSANPLFTGEIVTFAEALAARGWAPLDPFSEWRLILSQSILKTKFHIRLR